VSRKLLVTDTATGHQVPFLRGVLVQSLVAVGLSFSEAYGVAQRVRETLDASDETWDTTRLRKLVAEKLESGFGGERRRTYEVGQEHALTVRVTKPGRDEQFSVGLLSRHLEGCGIRHEDALEGARLVQKSLRDRGEPAIDSLGLRRVVYETLKATCRGGAADRFLSRCRFHDSGEPLIVLIGGATGAGKSTVAARLAYLLDIVRTQATDMMREIIRCYLMPHVAPTLGFSSFDAWRGLPEVERMPRRTMADNPVVAGFLSQLGTVKVALEATIQRAVKECDDLIVDGVHVLPTRLDLSSIRDKAVVVPLVLAVTSIARLDEQLKRRGREEPDRDAARHRESLDGIWDLQGFMVDQAEKAGIPVFANWDLDETIAQVIDEVMRQITQRFPPDPSLLES